MGNKYVGDAGWASELSAQIKPLEFSMQQQVEIEKVLRDAGLSSIKATQKVDEIAKLCSGVGVQSRMVLPEALADVPMKHHMKVAAIDSIAKVVDAAMSGNKGPKVEISPAGPSAQPPKMGT